MKNTEGCSMTPVSILPAVAGIVVENDCSSQLRNKISGFIREMSDTETVTPISFVFGGEVKSDGLDIDAEDIEVIEDLFGFTPDQFSRYAPGIALELEVSK